MRKKTPIPHPLPPAEASESDRAILTSAYKAGLIMGWFCDRERGFRLTVKNRMDEYVEPAKLTGYLEGLRKLAS